MTIVQNSTVFHPSRFSVLPNGDDLKFMVVVVWYKVLP